VNDFKDNAPHNPNQRTSTAMNTPAHTCLNGLLELPGVQNVLLIDHTGGCLAQLGPIPLPPAALTVRSVLARAAFSAGDELGQRTDCGSCHEITNLHERGGSIMRLVPGGQLLVLHFDATPALGTLRLSVREAAEKLASFLVQSPRTPSQRDDRTLTDSMSASGGPVLFEDFEAPDDDSGAMPHAMLCHED
jgi:predicted regulator of Ras-like GTPase activity (Roadblock/LC7/MglB family)